MSDHRLLSDEQIALLRDSVLRDVSGLNCFHADGLFRHAEALAEQVRDLVAAAQPAAALLRELLEYFGDDHSVGLCNCKDMRVLEALEKSLAAVKPEGAE